MILPVDRLLLHKFRKILLIVVPILQLVICSWLLLAGDERRLLALRCEKDILDGAEDGHWVGLDHLIQLSLLVLELVGHASFRGQAVDKGETRLFTG